MIKDTCPCGAQIEIEEQTYSFIREVYARWLNEHKPCRDRAASLPPPTNWPFYRAKPADDATELNDPIRAAVWNRDIEWESWLRAQPGRSANVAQIDEWKARAEKAEAELALHLADAQRRLDEERRDGTEVMVYTRASNTPPYETAPCLTKGVRYRVVERSDERAWATVGHEFVAEGWEYGSGNDQRSGWYALHSPSRGAYRVVRVEPEKCERLTAELEEANPAVSTSAPRSRP